MNCLFCNRIMYRAIGDVNAVWKCSVCWATFLRNEPSKQALTCIIKHFYKEKNYEAVFRYREETFQLRMQNGVTILSLDFLPDLTPNNFRKKLEAWLSFI